jgi:hypothetical protein
VFKREEVPVVWDSLELVHAAARQYNAGSDKGVANGLADEDLVRLCDPTMRAAMCTAIPVKSSPWCSTSPGVGRSAPGGRVSLLPT